MTEKELIADELRTAIEKEQEMVDDLNTKILAAYQCANMYPLRRNGFESDARKYSNKQDTIKKKIQWKRSVLWKYNCG